MRAKCRYLQYLRDAIDPRIQIQICNHNYLLADATHRLEERPRLLRPYQALVVDEAHKLPETARETVGTDRPSSSAIWLSVIGRRAAGPCSK